MPFTTAPRHHILRLLRSSGRLQNPAHGRQLHAHLLKTGFRQCPPFPVSLLNMYGKSRLLSDALLVFDETPQRDPILWSSLLSAHVQSNLPRQALSLLPAMIHVDHVLPDHYIFATIIKACTDLGVPRLGRQVHAQVLLSKFYDDDVVKSALVDMYSKCGLLDDARKVFDMVVSRNSVCWTAMVSGYSSGARYSEAVALFRGMPEKHLLAWTALISGFVQSGNNVGAMRLFLEMNREDVKLEDCFALSTVVAAAANLAALELGRQLHGLVISLGYEMSLFTANALVDMYAKCSNIVSASTVFESISTRDTVSWTTMIVGEAQHGRANEALALFEKMISASVRLNEVTFVGLLYACSHVGLVQKGRCIFNAMVRDYGIVPSLWHYTCMLDLLSRSGLLNEAEEFIKTMPNEPDEAMWAALLSSCKRFRDNERSVRIANHLLSLEPRDPSTYVLLSNVYAASGMWDCVAKVRQSMSGIQIRKTAGYSWVEVSKECHLF